MLYKWCKNNPLKLSLHIPRLFKKALPAPSLLQLTANGQAVKSRAIAALKAFAKQQNTRAIPKTFATLHGP